MKMKRLLMSLCLAVAATATATAQADSTAFRTYIYNEEYRVGLRINFYEQDIVVPGQELFGTMAGYLKKDDSSFCWLVVEARVQGNKARLLMANDYGSEDLEAELTCENDTTYTLRQLKGSALKVASNGKWQKLPRLLTFWRR